jgi:sugar phosphate isomerase/epimerase
MAMNLSRRDFVRTGALATAALATPSAVRAADGESAVPVKLGLCSYTFRNFDRAQLISNMKQLKVFALNTKDVKDHLPMDPTEEMKAVEDYHANGIELHAAGAIYFPKDEDEDIRNKFEYCKRAGIKVIVAGDPTPATLQRIEKFVKEYDIRFAIHNHGPEDKLWHSPLDVLKVVENMDPRMGCCIDIGHTARAGTNVVDAIKQVGPRLFNMHTKDLANFQSKDSQVAVGEGIMPLRQIFETLIAMKYDGYVDLEYEINGDNPMPGVTASFAYMRGVLAGMGYPTHA